MANTHTSTAKLVILSLLGNVYQIPLLRYNTKYETNHTAKVLQRRGKISSDHPSQTPMRTSDPNLLPITERFCHYHAILGPR